MMEQQATSTELIRVRLAAKAIVATDICQFEFEPAQEGELPPFSAGCHIDVHLPDGLVRQYSLCNGPRQTGRYRVGVLKDPKSRGGSVAMHALEQGQLVDISAPRNHFPLAPDSDHAVLIAGGIGITPLLSMAEHLLASGGSFELHYCARESQRAAFLERLTGNDLRAHTSIYFDSDAEGRHLDLDKVLGDPSGGKHLYVCGPSGFINMVLAEAIKNHWAPEFLHREYFGIAQVPSAVQGRFEVMIGRGGPRYWVEAGETVLDVLLRNGLNIPMSCEQGVCGTCRTGVLEGVPEHRDAFLTDAEKAESRSFLPCCSRSQTSMLVLDL